MKEQDRAVPSSSSNRFPILPLLAALLFLILLAYTFLQNKSSRKASFVASPLPEEVIATNHPVNPAELTAPQSATQAVGTVAGTTMQAEAAASENDIEKLPENERAEAYAHEGDLLIKAKRYREAIAALRRALSYDSQNESAHYNLALALAKTGEEQQAKVEYMEALRITPDYAEAHNNLGNLLLKEGKLDDALTHFKEAVRINPQNAIAYNNIGTALARKGRYYDAGENFSKAVALSPDYLEARFNLANAYIKEGLPNDAQRELNEALRIKPDFTPARQALQRLRGPRQN